MLLPTSCGPGPPLLPPPPPPPPPALISDRNGVDNEQYWSSYEANEGVKKLTKNMTQIQQKTIGIKTKLEAATRTTIKPKTSVNLLADNVLVEGDKEALKSVSKSITNVVIVDDDDFSIKTKNSAINDKFGSEWLNNNNWSILKLPVMFVKTTATKLLCERVANREISTQQIITTKNKVLATVGARATKVATTGNARVRANSTTTRTTTTAANEAEHTNANMSSIKVPTTTTTTITTPAVMKWLLRLLMIFAIMAQEPLHQVAAEKSKHYYMQALCKNHFLQQLYRKIDGAVLWSQNERNLDCIITFQTHSILQRFMLRFDMLQLDCNDHLYVYDGAHAVATPKIDISCRNTKQTVSSILTRTNFVTLKYVTDNWGTDANGFKLVITSVKDPKHTCNDFTCAAREFCISPDLLCDGINHCGDNSDESVCQSETAATVFGVDMTWFVLIVVGIVLVLSATIVGIAICVCRRQDEANLNQNTAIQMHHTAETNGSSKHLHYHHGGTLSREHTQLPPTSGNWHHPAEPYGYHRILRNLSKMATKVRPIWCLANSVN